MLFINSLLELLLALTLGLGLDLLFGEVKRYHPLVAFGRYARSIAAYCYRPRRIAGGMATLLAVMPAALFWFWPSHWLAQGLVLYVVIGGRSLGEHGRMVSSALAAGDIAEARQKVGWIVSRETSQMDQRQIVSATIESMLENGNDAVFGALFWFMVGGAPAAVLYRLTDTLDSMWGYKNERFLQFGWAAARLDDLLNLIPARLCALTYCALGNFSSGWRCWQTQAKQCASPNGGPVMTAGAGALNITIGGDAIYHGKLVRKSTMGCGHYANTGDIERAINLVNRGQLLWLLLLLAVTSLFYWLYPIT
ncbi:adenosylcobinamide-phosphate synthase CbiB [Ferrimonas senticii]|uniref:adenosylcobinamide-phosphate synthase CbiB n=1 Tax=Ferrimonas senticii TaxID=394566 RepID=UPI000402871E|nr:adenosylcobinamide-phosphate synthase CbiB [Ferrimonas senticii]